MAQNQKHIHTFGTSQDPYIHGLAKNGAKTHWPVGLVEVRENNRVFLKATDTFVGVQDNEILTEEATSVLIAHASAGFSEIVTEEDKENTTVSNSANNPATSVAAAFDKAANGNTVSDIIHDMPGVTVTKKEGTGSGMVSDAVEKLQSTGEAFRPTIEEIAKNTKAKIEAAVNPKANFIKEKVMPKSKSNNESLSLFGVILRVVLTIVLCVAMICLFIFGGQLAVGYIAGLGLSELMMTIATIGVATVAGGFSAWLATGSIGYIFDTISRREVKQSAAGLAAA